MKPLIIGICFSICIIVAIVVFLRTPVGKQLVTYFTPQPETFTELYFENHENLPSFVEAGERYTFTFSVHSEEYRKIVYQYSVYLQTDAKKISIQEGVFSLDQDQKKTITEHFVAPVLKQRAEVIVALENKKQQIDFWINE